MTSFLWLLFQFIIIVGFIVYCIIHYKKAKKENKTTWFLEFWKKDSTKSIFSSLISIVLGLLIGCIILFIMVFLNVKGSTLTLKSAFEGSQLIFSGVFNTGRENGELIFGFNGKNIGDMLFRATPLILTGLSVAVAFKTGLFNIGAPGQYLIGLAVSLILALVIPTTVIPSFIVWVIAFIGGIVAGALWGAIPGMFKAFLNVNEVITCIMTNWIAANLVTMLFDRRTGPFNFLLDPSPTKNNAYVFQTTHNNIETTKLGLDYIFPGSQINAGILVAILIAIVVFIIMNKTTLGYQLKACGNNRDASRYAGINEKLCIVLSMAIAGGLSGAAAALFILSGNTEFAWETYQTLPAVGFNGIPAALLAFNNPIGVIFSSSFISLLNVNGMQLKYMTPYNEHITSIITAIIVYFSAFSLIFKQLLDGTIKIDLTSIFKRTNKNTIVTIEKTKEEVTSIKEGSE